MPLVLTNRRRRGGSASAPAFSPSSLYSSGSQGIWLDPSDLSTMFSDRAGTTPVTTPGTVVGLRLDKSKGLVLGAELVSNGTFDTDASEWSASAATLSSVSQELLITSTGSSGGAYQTFNTVAGRAYKLNATIRNGSSVGIRFRVSNGTVAGGTGDILELLGDQSIDRYFFALGATTTVFVRIAATAAGQTGFADNISVRELAGNHAVAPTDAARPIYGVEPKGGRRNLLVQSEAFDTASWAKDSCTVPATQYLAPDGTTTADRIVSANATAVTGVGQSLASAISTSAVYTASYYVQANGARYIQVLWSGGLSTNFANFDLQNPTAPTAGTYTSATITAAANGFYRITITSTLAAGSGGSFLWLLDSGTAGRGTSYTGNGTSGIYVWGAQMELGSTATAYQRVTTAYDVTESGVPTCHYVQYDGSDDSMSTAAIDFTATDKMSVFAGVRKLSDAADACLVELSASAGSNNGSFHVFTGPNPSAPNRYSSFTKGSAGFSIGSWATTNIGNAPDAAVLATTHDIAGDLTTIRRNGVAGTSATVDLGSGNFATYPLFIGRRNNSVAAFNGKDYGILVVGKAVTPTEITDTETWLAARTSGVTI